MFPLALLLWYCHPLESLSSVPVSRSLLFVILCGSTLPCVSVACLHVCISTYNHMETHDIYTYNVMYVHIHTCTTYKYIRIINSPCLLDSESPEAGGIFHTVPQLCVIHCLAPAPTQEIPVTRIGKIL